MGALLQSTAINLAMLFTGPLILGGGTGFANQVGCRQPSSRQGGRISGHACLGSGHVLIRLPVLAQAVPLYISEMAPAHMRGQLNIMVSKIFLACSF